MRRPIIAAIAFFASLGLVADAQAVEQGCSPQGALSFICGTIASEDVVQVPGTHYLVVSGLGLGQPGKLYLVDTQKRQARLMAVNSAEEATVQCKKPGAQHEFSFAGLHVRKGKGGALKLYAANGAAGSIEVFTLDLRNAYLGWQECVPLPANVKPNSTVALADGAILATRFVDQTDPNAWGKMARGEPSGAVYEHSGSTFRPLPGLDAISGPNGIELSADEKTLYVSAWATRELLVFTRSNGHIRKIPLDFLPDNIKRQKDGSLIVAGQRTSIEAIAKCSRDCPQPWVIARVDPQSGKVTTLLEGPGDSTVNYATGATMIGNTLYSALRGDNRILYTKLSKH